MQAQGLQPIDTAPTDGTVIHIYAIEGDVVVISMLAQWGADEWVHPSDSECTWTLRDGCGPTHWSPAPAGVLNL